MPKVRLDFDLHEFADAHTFDFRQTVVVNRYPGPAGNPTRPIAGFARIFQFESTSSSLYHGGFKRASQFGRAGHRTSEAP